MKRLFKGLSLSVLIAVSAAHGMSDIDSRVSTLERQIKDVRIETAMGTFGATTAIANGDVDGEGWFLLFGPIYEHPRVGGTEFAYTTQQTTTPFSFLPQKGSTKDIDFKWAWGIRAGVGYNFDYDGWDLQALYQWLSSNGNKQVDVGLLGYVVPLKGTTSIVANCSNFTANDTYLAKFAKSQFAFNHHSIVLQLGRSYFVSSLLSLRPFFGFRATYLNLQQLVRFMGGESSIIGNIVGLGVNTVTVADTSRLWGLGPRAGVNTDWFLASGFSIFGNASFSLLYGWFDVNHREKFSLCPSSNRIKLLANEHRYLPATQLQLGLKYSKYFDSKHQKLEVSLGYDSLYYWRANQMLKVNEFAFTGGATEKFERYSEDVSIRGVTFDVKWSF